MTHGNEVKRAERNALTAYEGVLRRVESGECRLALEQLDDARFFMGKAAAHRDSGAVAEDGSSLQYRSTTQGLNRTADDAHAAFESGCLVKARKR